MTASLTLRLTKGSPLTHLELDTNFQNLSDEVDGKQAASANLTEYAAVNPTAAGLALLDDADANAQLTTLGGTSTGTSIFKAASKLAATVALGLGIVTPVHYAATGGTRTAAAGDLADETTELQAMIDGTSAGGMIDLMGKSWKATALTLDKLLYFINGRLVFTNTSGTLFDCDENAELYASDVEFEGPADNLTYIAEHKVIAQTGTSSASRAKAPKLTNCTIKGSGSYGLWVKFADGAVLDNVKTSDCAYASIMFVSCDKGRVRGGYLNMLGAVGTSANAYGLTLTHVSTGYDVDPNAATPLATNPFCNDWVIDGVTTLGPEIWTALDQHGGYNIGWTNNRCFACKLGIHMAGGSGDAVNYGGWHNFAIGNVVDVNMPDGTSASVTPLYGIMAQGGTSFPNTAVTVSGNTIKGFKGDSSSISIRLGISCEKFVVSNNVILDWGRTAIMISTGSLTGIIEGNVTSALGETTTGTDEIIDIQGTSAARITLSSHVHSTGGDQPAVGLRVGASFTGKVYVGAHGMDHLATPVSTPNNVCHGPGFVGTVALTAVTGAQTPDLSLADICPGIPIRLLCSALTGNVTIASMTMKNGGQVRVVNNDATSTVTLQRAGNMRLSGGVDAVLGQYDEILLVRTAQSGNPQWTSSTPVIANG